MTVDSINYALVCSPPLSPRDYLRKSQLDIGNRIKTEKCGSSVPYNRRPGDPSILPELTVFPQHPENDQRSLGDSN